MSITKRDFELNDRRHLLMFVAMLFNIIFIVVMIYVDYVIGGVIAVIYTVVLVIAGAVKTDFVNMSMDDLKEEMDEMDSTVDDYLLAFTFSRWNDSIPIYEDEQDPMLYSKDQFLCFIEGSIPEGKYGMFNMGVKPYFKKRGEDG